MSTKKERSEAARALSQRGASKGGKARAGALTAKERRDIALAGARARWGKDVERLDFDDYLIFIPDNPQLLQDAMERFMRLTAAASSDFFVFVLKGHAFIDEQLLDLLNLSVPQGADRLSFSAKVETLKRIVGEIPLCDALTKFNVIRNKLAHEPDPSGIAEDLEAFVSACRGTALFARLLIPMDDNEELARIGIECLWGALYLLVDRARSSVLGGSPS